MFTILKNKPNKTALSLLHVRTFNIALELNGFNVNLTVLKYHALDVFHYICVDIILHLKVQNPTFVCSF